MRKVWNGFEQWLKINRPDVLGTLNDAATESQIAEAEQK
jgi:cell wall assembly regulator SMI1